MGKLSPLTKWRKITCSAESPLSSSARLVCNIIANDMDRHLQSWPGQERIAANANLDVKTVKRAIREIAKAGFLKVVPGGSDKGGNRHSSHYTAVLPTGVLVTGVIESDRGNGVQRPGELCPPTGGVVPPEGVKEGDKEGVRSVSHQNEPHDDRPWIVIETERVEKAKLNGRAAHRIS